MIKIQKPTLVVDLARVEQNIIRMANKMKVNGVGFRPHFKTHQSAFIANLFKEVGVNKCTVSSVDMAFYFAANGWDDITIAFPVNILEIDKLNDLAKQIQLNLLLDSIENVNFLGTHLSNSIGLFIEVDTGYLRSGIGVKQLDEIKKIILAIEAFESLNLMGFLSHTGNTYSKIGEKEVKALFSDAKNQLVHLKNQFIKEFPSLILSLGDTPAASICDQFEGIDEMRPGNFVFYDVTQFLIGSCSQTDIAVRVYCPVVAKYPERNQLVIYGGGVHLSKEKVKEKGQVIYGFVSKIKQNVWSDWIEGAFVQSLSQEHGIIYCPKEEMDQIEIGELISVTPVHSCMTADLNAQYLATNGQLISKYRTY
ncbi:MAG: alanine racemase [Bacteroidales bacterium]|nr:alanine racemase [Bacteroidales bacterium]